MIAKAPEQLDIIPRNPDKKIILGGGHILFGNVSSPPNYFNLEIGRKVTGNHKKCANLLKIK